MNSINLITIKIISLVIFTATSASAVQSRESPKPSVLTVCSYGADKILNRVCEDIEKNCYWGVPSHTLICRRTFHDLVKTKSVYPVNVVEIYGKVVKKEKSFLLVDIVNASKNTSGYSIQILDDSCKLLRVGGSCDRMLNREVTIIGAYFVERKIGAPLKRNGELVGKILVLDFFYGKRKESKIEIDSKNQAP